MNVIQNWNLVWSDEFEGVAGTQPSPAIWTPQLGAGGWGNQELETYTASTENLYQDGHGNLVIKALKTHSGYTSGRITTANSYAFGYGKLEARIKIPFGDGLWPGFWLIGSNYATAVWPECGEIDILEAIGRVPSTVFSTIHGPGYENGVGVSNTLAAGKFSDDYHVFGIIRDPNSIQFQVDDVTYATLTPVALPVGATWVFNQPFILLLNVAVGGMWAGYPDKTTVFPQSMLVDYVRYSVPQGIAIPNHALAGRGAFQADHPRFHGYGAGRKVVG